MVRLCSGEVKHPVCDRMLNEMESLTGQVINLLTAFQRRTLLHSNSKSNTNLIGFICLVMAAVSYNTLSFPLSYQVLSTSALHIDFHIVFAARHPGYLKF